MKRNIIAILIANGLMVILYFAFPNFWDHSIMASGSNDHAYENVIGKALDGYQAYVDQHEYIPAKHKEILAELAGLHKVPNLSVEQNKKLKDAIERMAFLEDEQKKQAQEKDVQIEQRVQELLRTERKKLEEENRTRQQVERERTEQQTIARKQAERAETERQIKAREKKEREKIEQQAKDRENKERERIEHQAKERGNRERAKTGRQTDEEGKISVPSDSLKSNKNTSASVKFEPGTVKQQIVTKSTQSTSKVTLGVAEYKVSRGETLYSIAQKFNTTVEKIVNDNPKRERNEDVKKGEILLIKMAKDTAEVRKMKWLPIE